MGDFNNTKSSTTRHEGLYISTTPPSRQEIVVKKKLKTSPSKELIAYHIQKDLCLSLCGELCEILNSNKQLLTESSQVCSPSETFSSRCTVGLMLHGVRVENTLIGGPSFGLIERGDVIVRIDGEIVTESDVFERLRGCDLPGSQVLITVERYGSNSPLSAKSLRDFEALDSREVDIHVTRMATAQIADRRRMFDLFTLLEVFFNSTATKLQFIFVSG